MKPQNKDFFFFCCEHKNMIDYKRVFLNKWTERAETIQTNRAWSNEKRNHREERNVSLPSNRSSKIISESESWNRKQSTEIVSKE